MPRRHGPRTAARAGLPLAQVVEADDGTLRVLLDGQLLVAPTDRSNLGRVLSVLAERHGSLRVELTDATGQVFVEVLHPPAGSAPLTPDAPPPTPDPPETPPADSGRGSGLMEVSGEGFVPGEEVQVAVIVQSSSAGPSGRARGLVDPFRLPVCARGVVLLGTVSGTLHVEYLP